MQTKRTRIILLCGGISPEHNVSLSSAETAARELEAEKYDILPVCIRHDGRWLFPSSYLGKDRVPNDIIECFDMFRASSHSAEKNLKIAPVENVLPTLKSYDPEVVFILLHGKGGEDGIIQAFLEAGGFRYTGSGVLASALGMDKIRCLRILAGMGYLAPPYVFQLEIPQSPDFTRIIRTAEKKFGYPCFVKPARVGSSVGMNIAENREELEQSLTQAAQFDSQLVIEEFIRGTEITCGILDSITKTGEIDRTVFHPTEIVVKQSSFFDYKSKYTPGMTEEITPARISEEMTKRVQDTAAEIHKLIGCAGMSRVDMIIRDQDIYILEINTIPGMTPTSLLPQGAKASGIEFSSLLDAIVRHALYANRER